MDNPVLALQRETLANPITAANQAAVLANMERLSFSPGAASPFLHMPRLPVHAPPPAQPTIRLEPIDMRTIAPGIAYLGIRTENAGNIDPRTPEFIAHWAAPVADFYRQIQDYQHLIIDLRGERFVSLDFLGEALLGPLNGNHHVTLPFVAFFQDGQYSHMFGEAIAGGHLMIETAQDIIGHLPSFCEEDAALLAYGFPWPVTIPSGLGDSAFTGEVWVLVDNDTAAAAETFAKALQTQRLATIVGTQTLGAPMLLGHGENAAIAILPHTGVIVAWCPIYLTDMDGRLVNAHHVTPDHIIDGQTDTLEAVLNIIRP